MIICHVLLESTLLEIHVVYFFFFYHDNLCFRTQAKNITKNKFYIKKMNFETVKKA